MKKITSTTILAALLSGVVPAPAGETPPEPICGDVNDSNSVNTSDALLVLRKGVGLPVTLDCEAYETRFAACDAELQACLADPVCGNGIVDEGEDCEAGDLGGATCVTLGFAGGTASCAAGCALDTSDCYETRFDVSEETVIDRKTGLEWEKKSTQPGSGSDYMDPHDVDNVYSWGSIGGPTGSAFTDFLAKLNTGAMSVDENGETTWSCFAGHCDWRLPTIEELQTIAVPYPTCPAAPCVVEDALLPMHSAVYWSASTHLPGPAFAWSVEFSNGYVFPPDKTSAYYVRAVRSCP